MLLVAERPIYVRFAADQVVRTGESYTVFRAMKDWERSRTRRARSCAFWAPRWCGATISDKRVARAVITEAMDPIERGLFVAKLDRRFDLVEPKREQQPTWSPTSSRRSSRTLLAEFNVVFLDVGARSRYRARQSLLHRASRRRVVERIDAKPEDLGNVTEVPRYDPSILPKEVVAELRVIKVRKNDDDRSDYALGYRHRNWRHRRDARGVLTRTRDWRVCGGQARPLCAGD